MEQATSIVYHITGRPKQMPYNVNSSSYMHSITCNAALSHMTSLPTCDVKLRQSTCIIKCTMTIFMTVTHKRRGILKSLPSCTPSEFSFASVLPCKNSLSESASIVHNEMSLQFVVVLSLNIWVREGITTKCIITQCNVFVQIIQ